MPALIIFIQNPEKGNVLPWLAPDIGEAGALQLYRQLQQRTMRVTAGFDGEKFLFYSDFPNWNDGWDVATHRKRLQRGDSAGSRIMAAFEEIFEEGYQSALLLAVGTYDIDEQQLTEAVNQLAGNALVVGTDQHGASYLLGLHSPFPEMLRHIAWNTEAEAAQIMAVADELNIPVKILPARHQLVTLEDLQQSGMKHD